MIWLGFTSRTPCAVESCEQFEEAFDRFVSKEEEQKVVEEQPEDPKEQEEQEEHQKKD
jgi:hypothetical protein